MIIQANIHFEELSLIRNGPLSRVFLAHDKQLDANIVVKEIKKSDFSNPEEYFGEARILYSMKHPNIAEVQYACEKDEFIYLSMPYYPHGSLEKLYNEKALSVREIIKYALDFLKGLHFIHTKGLIHLDVKPGNVLINNSGVAMLTDFGLSKYVNPYDLVKIEKIYGPHRYPESFSTNFASKQSDIFQVGVTLYRMCNGDLVFLRQIFSQENIENGIYPDRNFYLPHIPKKIINTINKALHINPESRHVSVLDLMNDLSLVDSSLDWSYNHDVENRKQTWTLNNETMTEKHIHLFKLNDTWKIVGKKKNKANLRETNINNWNMECESESEAFKQIRKIIENEK